MKGNHEICNMQILLIAATAKEIEPFTATDTKAEVLIAGVGVPNTLYHLQKRLHHTSYNLVIQAGIAGSFSKDIILGQAVFIKQDCFADLGWEEQEIYTPIFESGLADKNEFPFNNGWLINTSAFPGTAVLKTVNGITVNKISDSSLQNRQFKKQFNADVETMEGAALHFVCLQENIPFIQLRTISNYVGERDKSKWKMTDAIENLNHELNTFINGLFI